MTWKNTRSTFGLSTKILHWTFALGVLTEYGLILYRDYFVEAKSATAGFLIGGIHKPIGVILTFVGCFAYAWKLKNSKPTFETDSSPFEKLIAHLVHSSLYWFLMLMPLSGWMMSSFAAKPINMFGIITVPAHLDTASKENAEFFHSIHHYLAYAGFVLIFLHLGGILKQTVLKKEAVISRMLPWVKHPQQAKKHKDKISKLTPHTSRG